MLYFALILSCLLSASYSQLPHTTGSISNTAVTGTGSSVAASATGATSISPKYATGLIILNATINTTWVYPLDVCSVQNIATLEYVRYHCDATGSFLTEQRWNASTTSPSTCTGNATFNNRVNASLAPCNCNGEIDYVEMALFSDSTCSNTSKVATANYVLGLCSPVRIGIYNKAICNTAHTSVTLTFYNSSQCTTTNPNIASATHNASECVTDDVFGTTNYLTFDNLHCPGSTTTTASSSGTTTTTATSDANIYHITFGLLIGFIATLF